MPKTEGTSFPARYGRVAADGRVVCEACPRLCTLKEGQRGLCFVRANEGGQLVLKTYGRSSGFCVDPIEKKPLAHFLPGSSVLSFGTAGCNLTCKFCQNWDISKSRENDTLQDEASPEAIAQAALRAGCRSVAYTYNDPVIFAEYAMDVADACRDLGIQSVAVTAGYMGAEARRDFYAKMDAANVDLKGFTEDFCRNVTGASLASVLETLRYIRHETKTWLELTTLLIPTLNDSEQEIRAMCRWIHAELGDTVPLHFSAFHPDYKLRDMPATPVSTVRRARKIALEEGLKHVYTGNVHDPEGDTTRCESCSAPVIERDWYEIVGYRLDEKGRCPACGQQQAGVFDGPPGSFGRRRFRVAVA
jgi:pyruvate formate lyase activating enzyme